MTPTIKNAKLLGANKWGWLGFKKNLMKALNIPSNQVDTYNVPDEWKKAFCKANKRDLF